MVEEETMKGIELRTCPFCGGEAEINNEIDMGQSYYVINCKTCHASPDGAISIDVNVAAAAWNRRAGDAP